MRALLLSLIASIALAGPAAAADVRVAVLEFTNASADAELAPLGKGLQSMLTTDLAGIEAVDLVERARLTEIRTEIDLGQSAYVDPETAVRMGKLAGATHLLTGSFTVVGAQMRLDARLFGVQDGAVLLGEEITGETEAFFELEKELVRKLVSALGLQLAARERAAVARIHTADFEAFSSFSRGIDLFDREAYDDAVEQLRDATSRDEDFKLARVTLQEYERIIGELRSRRDELSAARDQMERLEKLAEAQAEAAVVEKLFEIAGRTGSQHQRERLTAKYLLAVAYGNIGSRKSKLLELRQVEDQWAMLRTADTFAASYFSEALPLWPALPLVVDDGFYRSLPELASFDADFAEAVEHLWEYGADYPENRRNYLTSPLRWPWQMSGLLHLTVAEEVALRETFIDRGAQLDPGDFWRREQAESMVEDYRRVLRLDEATALLTRDAAGEDNPHVLEGIARQVEHNRDFQALLEQAKDKARMAEWIMLAQAADWSRGPIVKQGEDHFSGAGLDEEGLALLDRVRKRGFDDSKHLLIGPHPTWTLQAPWWLRTGPRTDPRQAEQLRYYKDKPSNDETDTVVLFDGVPRADLEARFELGFDRPDDLGNSRIASGGWVDGRPIVGFVFGVRDVRVKKQEDASGERVIVRPTTQWMVRFDADAVRLVRMVETVRGSYERKDGWDEQLIGESRHKWGRGPSKVTVAVSDAGVVVTVDGKRHRFDAPAERTGFYGLQIRGIGFAEVARVRIDGR